MRNLFFIAVLFLSGAAQAAEIILPPTLPSENTETEIAENNPVAPINEASNDVVEGAVLPNPIPVASANSAAVFEFPVIKNPVEHVSNSASPFVAPASKTQEYQANNANEAEWLEAIRRSLLAKNAGEKIVLDGVRYDHKVQEAKTASAGVWQVQDVAFDARKGQFNGKLVAVGKEFIAFSGRYSAMQMVPVLKNRLSRGAVISENDIEMKPILQSRLRTGVSITDPKELIGKTLRRVIATGMPLHPFDLASQIVITPNSQVEMIYSSGGIEVSDRGTALENGAIGEIIRVKNSKSGSVLNARVDSPTQVSVGYFAAPKRDRYAAN